MQWFEDSDKITLTINDIDKLESDIRKSKKLLYLGDNCGEICLDKLLIKKIKDCNPNIDIYFGVRGKPVVNDSIEEDAYFVGIDEYAKIISNGDDSLGTILSRTSKEFNQIYHAVDIVISKGHANYESLSVENDRNIYFLLVTKCDVIANDIGVPIKSFICMNKAFVG
jgi:damage-control phosphatase, subfamily I